MFSGYYLVTETTSLRGGWYSTGDLGFTLEGELYITGRMDDVIIIRGKNLYAHDLEYAITHEGVKPGRSVAFGIYNEKSGSQDLVVVAERSCVSTDRDLEIVRWIKAEIFAITGATVSDVHLVQAGWLVKTTSGKISREANAEKYLDGIRRV